MSNKAIRIAYANISEKGDWKHRLKIVTKVVQKAVKRKADIILFPECYPLASKDETGLRQKINRLCELIQKYPVILPIIASGSNPSFPSDGLGMEACPEMSMKSIHWKKNRNEHCNH